MWFCLAGLHTLTGKGPSIRDIQKKYGYIPEVSSPQFRSLGRVLFRSRASHQSVLCFTVNGSCLCETVFSNLSASQTELFLVCRTLCESLEDLSLVFVVSSHKLFMELLKEEERKVLVERLRKRSATISLSAKPLPSFYDIPGAEIRHDLFCVNVAACWR